MKKQISRRVLLKSTAAALSFPYISRCMGQSPNEKLNHACIGVSGMGRSDLISIVRGGKVNIAAICDIDEKKLNEAAELLKTEYKMPDVRKYRDWRELLAREDTKIDSVNVTTPDHMHAPISYTAIQKGKHVYCQKPLTHTVNEARILTAAARKAQVVTQMGIQIHSDIAYRMAARIIRDGKLGKIREWHSWQSGSAYAQGLRPTGSDPVPSHVDWDKWLGVAPFREFKLNEYHPFKWRGRQDFGGGVMGDFACHIFDPVFTAIEVRDPLSVKATVPEVNQETFPEWQVVEYEFSGTQYTEGEKIKGTWYQSGKMPDRSIVPMPENYKLPHAGSIIVGQEGVMVLPHWAGPQLYPLEKFKGYKRPAVKSVDHYQEWVDGCMGKGKPDADFDFSGPLTEAVQLGNLSIHYGGKTLSWDAKNMRITNIPDANKRLGKQYRAGWQVRGLG